MSFLQRRTSLPTDIHSIFRTDVFTFQIGPDKKQFKVHPGVLRSQALRKMIDNGMKESVDKIAMLESVDPETFELFLEFAYTGSYRAASDDENEPLPLPERRHCTPCGEVLTRDDVCPLGCMEHNPRKQPDYCAHCGEGGTDGDEYCDECFEKQVQNFCPLSFFNREYPLSKMSHDKARAYLPRLEPEDGPTSKLVSHAKLFVFANTYLIDDLQKLCLHKLHRDLLVYDLEVNGVDEIIVLLEYSYCNTEMADEGFPGVGVDLRNLAMAYAGGMATKLLKFPAFRTMIAKGGNLAVEFACLLVKETE